MAEIPGSIPGVGRYQHGGFMEHRKCKYYFEAEVTKQKECYNSLLEDYEYINYKKVVPLCGVSANSIELFDNQPICQQFSEKT